MKKMMAFILSAIMLFGSTGAVFARESWQEVYSKLLKAYISGAKGNAIDYEGFALYDLDQDGVPELLLKEMTKEENFQLYRYKDGEAFLEMTFTSNGFYKRVGTGDLVISYGDNNGTTYVVYEQDVNILKSDYVIFKTERYREKVADDWSWFYYYLDREVTETQFNDYLKENLTSYEFNFREITDDNINRTIYENKSFFAKASDPLLTIEKSMDTGFETSVIKFPDGNEVNWRNDGVSELYGLLMVNGIFITDAVPAIENDSTLVPVRIVSENLEASVGWDSASGTVTVEKEGIEIIMVIGERTATVNKVEHELPVAAQIINGSTYVPLRFVSEGLDANVYYQETKGDFPVVIAIEEKYFYGIDVLREDQVVDIVQAMFNNVQWGSVQTVFTQTYMNNLINVRSDGLQCGRFWSVIVDQENTVKIWVDRYTGEMYTFYSNDEETAILRGEHHALDALTDRYL